MRIAIVGVGGVGGYFGGRLAQAGEDVVFIARGAHLQALLARGLQVDSIAGDFRLERPEAIEDPQGVGPVDAILLCVKAWQVEEAARSLPPLLGPQTCVVPLQNGVEAYATLAAALGSQYVLGGLCSLIAYVIEPGHIRHAAVDPLIRFGERDNRRSDRVDRLRDVFARAEGIAVDIPDDIEAALWEKFLFIAAFGGIGALTRAPIGVVRSQSGTRRMLRQAMEEIFAVATARRVSLSRRVIDATMAMYDGMPADGTASMQRDIMHGRPSELEAQTGAVVRLGREAGVATPINALIYDSLLPAELRARGKLDF